MSQPELNTQSDPGLKPSRKYDPVTFGGLVRRFLFSRCIFVVIAFAIAVIGRYSIPKPIRWFEPVAACVLLLAWPRLEFLVHYLMHHAKWTNMYRRHKMHHDGELDHEVASTYVLYNLIAIPFIPIHWALGQTLVATLLFAVAAYEFVHFSTHQPYRPITAWGKLTRRNHLLHHHDRTTRLELIFPKRR